MKLQDNSIFFYCSKVRYIFSFIICLLCSVFAVYVIFKMAEFKWLALAALVFFVYKSGTYFYEAFLNNKPLIELRKKEIVIDGCPALNFKDIEGIGYKRVNSGSSEMLYVCMKTDETKFQLTDLQKDYLEMGLTAFCFRPSVLPNKDADFLIRELLAETNQQPVEKTKK